MKNEAWAVFELLIRTAVAMACERYDLELLKAAIAARKQYVAATTGDTATSLEVAQDLLTAAIAKSSHKLARKGDTNTHAK
jgi:hypothetical protein